MPNSVGADRQVNSVQLRGRVTTPPRATTLPSGDQVVNLRVTVTRGEADAGRPRRRRAGAARPGADWVDCAVWDARLQRSMVTWRIGDPVEIEGRLRRRFFRGHTGPISRLEVEVAGARRVRPTRRR